MSISSPTAVSASPPGPQRCRMARVSRPASPAAAVQEREAYAALTPGPAAAESWHTSLASPMDGQWAPVGSARSINRRWARRRGLDDGASGLFLEYWSGAAATTTATHVLVVVLPVDRLMGQNQNPQTGGRPRTAHPSRAASGRVCPSRD
ncbi:hypothetical protein COCCADRAFT_1072 [Bipolaris zeicola 26-R-13]|uniref:Uncharacterized protein n=1 Tax=Cochliobolus carbonum (strain 26-R-13) TaxID=930089 RepID=W6Z2X1_COCC2|nr:uncharacterized protein COCCADRAFT_1072 [Bipolaris zeicola 26-R-13]EUC38031.1 hypothetical protein COCCADRAFT_1072 [Bipolaris zeicola 26-R-13]